MGQNWRVDFFPGESLQFVCDWLEESNLIKPVFEKTAERSITWRITYGSEHPGTFNPAVITNKEAHKVADMVI